MASATRQNLLLKTVIELREGDASFRQGITPVTYAAGEEIANADLLARNLFIIMKGRVQLVHAGPNGRHLTLAILDPGASFGDAPLGGQADPHAYAVALTNCMIWRVSAAQAQAMVLSYPVLSLGLLQNRVERLAQVQNRMEDVAYKRLPAQLATLLLQLANGGRSVRGISHDALARMLGTYRETVSSILRTFKSEGMVNLGYRRIDLRDVHSLTEAAEVVD